MAYKIRLPPTRLLLSTLTISALCVFPDGYHLGVVNIPQTILIQFVNESIYAHFGTVMSESQLNILWAFIANSYMIGGIFGAWATMFFAEKYGRKTSLLVINNVVSVLASLLMGISKVSNSMELLTIGRFIIGLNSGLATGLLGMYLTECSPNEHRGLTASFVNFFITLTTLISQIVALPQLLGTNELWPLLLALAAFPSLAQLAIFWMFPESPKHLLLTKKNELDARRSIEYFHGDKADVQAVMDEFRREHELAKEELTLKEALSDYDLWWPIFMSAVINVAQIATGITAVFTYSTSIFTSVGVSEDDAPIFSMITSIFNLCGGIASLFLIDRWGRRPLMLIGLVACLICDIVFMIFSLIGESNRNLSWPPYVALVAIMIHVTVFNIGPGPIAWFISSESTPQSVRSIGASVSITVNWISGLVCGLVYFPLQEAVGAWSFLIFIVPTSLCIVFLWWKMPETKNRTIDEIMQTWSRKVRLEDRSHLHHHGGAGGFDREDDHEGKRLEFIEDGGKFKNIMRVNDDDHF